VRSFLLVLSSLITVVAVIPYLNAVAQGRDEPRIATWIVWAALAWVGAAASLSQPRDTRHGVYVHYRA
jgi:hypothetical protein